MHKMSTIMTSNSNNNNDTNSSLNNSQTQFYPITKSVSVPDIHNNHDAHSQVNSRSNVLNNLLLTNSESIESAIADSPAGSLEQFEVNANTPLSTDDQVDSIADTLRESHPNSNNSSFSSVTTQKYDSNSPSFRFRRHSSQSAINVNSNQAAATGFSSTNREICSSPINSLKMSSRVCQIKIDEGIEPHLSREIKSEREMQNTLKLKTSCDELILNNDDLSLETFSFDNNNRVSNDINRTNSPVSATISSVTTFRQNSQSNMPSPSMSSCYSYSNSSSPTAGLSTNNNNPGLLRCFSPSTALANNSINATVNQNYFSQSPSPTRKLFVTRRSMSPIQLRPSTLSGLNSNNKRKLSDLDPSDSSQIALCSPKRSNNESQEFVQPLQIFTGTNANLPRPIGTVRSLTSSPFSSLSTTPSSPNQNSISSLIITSGPSENNNNQLRQDLKLNSDNKTSICSSSSFKPNIEFKTEDKQPKFLWPSATIQSQNYINNDTSNKTEDKYTFKPIQLPPPATTFNNPQRKRFINTLTTSTNSTNTASFSSLAQVNQTNNSPMNSPAHYLCDSPISYSPSVSNISSSIAGEKPDSGYQSSIQNNSDSESCI